MLNDFDTVKLTFGLKVQQLRREHALSYQQLSERTGLAVSYLHNIEKGKKYPKADKIIALAKALDTDYNYLVSLDAEENKKIKPLIDLLHSDFLKEFPLDRFGINMPKLLELLSHTPDKVNAFLSTILKIIRNFRLQGEDFYKSALRSYQDLHHNYFPDLEKAVRQCKTQHSLAGLATFDAASLEAILRADYGVTVDRNVMAGQRDLRHIRSFFAEKPRRLFLNRGLSSAQENFLLAKEFGFQWLGITERPYETRMIEIDTFDKLLNNFRASYFAVALLLDEDAIVEDIRQIARWEAWDGRRFLSYFDKYDTTPEMLLQRLANLLPHHFGIKDLFFLRFYTGPDMQKFEMTKEMHLSQLHDPHANQLDEHYCRRWISINLIRRMRANVQLDQRETPLTDAQISQYWGTPNAYLCISVARPGHEQPDHSNSVTIGLLVNDQLRRLFRFLADPKLVRKDVHTTCERCPIADCGARVAPPVNILQQHHAARTKACLETLQQHGIAANL